MAVSMTDSLYSNAISAVVRSLAVDVMDSTTTQSWQRLFRSGYQSSLPIQSIKPEDSLDYDCWVHGRLHHQLKSRYWHVLVAKYSTHKARKVESIGLLIPHISSNASPLFVAKAVTAWAIPKLKGKDGKRSTDLMVLPAAFYDLNTWDASAAPERTRRRWRSGVFKELENLLTEALTEAEKILKAEGVLRDDGVC